MKSTAFAKLGKHLPRIAEEGTDREAISEAALTELIATTEGDAQAKGLVATFRRLFLALGLLDEASIDDGIWQFVSFPASLCARSLLASLADDNYRLLEKGYWEPSEFRVDRQRALLRQLELQRRAASPATRAIRRVWVSWAIVASDGKFLMVRREDGREERPGSRGRFVFPGGKVSSADLTGLSIDERLAFFDPNESTERVKSISFLKTTLARELDEELELDSSAFNSITAIGSPIKYIELEGAGSSHALTEYFIQLFRIQLTESGKNTLLRTLERYAERFSWFSGEDLSAGTNELNETAFVDALKYVDSQSLMTELGAAKSDIQFSATQSFAESVDVPECSTEPFLIGITGRERACLSQLDAGELADIAFLAALRRGDPIQELAPGLASVPHLGWLIVGDDTLLQHFRAMSAKLQRDLPDFSLLATSGRCIRLNARDPSTVCFSGGWMSLTAEDERRGKSFRIRLERRAIKSKFGVASALSQEARVSEKLGASIYGLLNHDPDAALENLDTIKRVQRTELKAFLTSVGLRLLIRQVDGVPELSVKLNT